jgi:DNA-binding NarL/FixJ family response regulator
MLCIQGRRGGELPAAVAIRSTVQESHAEQKVGGAVVLLDEHPIWMDALEDILSSTAIRVIGKATSPEAALKLVDSEKPDALLVSLELWSSKMGGVECLRRARERAPGLRIVAFSTHHDPLHLNAAVTAGADAYLPKTAHASEVTETVHDCLVGERRKPRAHEANGNVGPRRPALTARELEIIHLVAHGYTNPQIAERLGVTKWTVKFHLVNAYRKLGVSNRTQAARYLFEHGLSGVPVERSS